MLIWIFRQRLTASFYYEVLELFCALVFALNDLLSFAMDLVESIELFLQLDDFFIALVESGSKGYDDVSLFDQ